MVLAACAAACGKLNPASCFRGQGSGAGAGSGGAASCNPCRGMSSMLGKRSQLDSVDLLDIALHYPVEADDSLKMAAFITWLTDLEMSGAATQAAGTTFIVEQQDVLSNMCDRLYKHFVRCFILQLMHSLQNPHTRMSMDSRGKEVLVGYIKHAYALITEQEEQESDMDIIVESCYMDLTPLWELFDQSGELETEKDKRRQDASYGLERDLDKLPPEEIRAKVSEVPKNLKNGTKVDSSHVNYRMAYGMMVGLETTVRLENGMRLYNSHVYGLSAFRKELEKQMQDKGYPFCFESFHSKPAHEGSELSEDLISFVLASVTLTYQLPSSGSWFSPPHIMGDSEDLWFEDLAPAMFSKIRRVCNVEGKEYLRSVSKRGFTFIEFQTNSKSGEIFFFSHDGRFLLKTISDKEARQLIKMLPDYYMHIQDGKSYLMRVCGLHRFSSGGGHETTRYFLVAMSVFHSGDMGLHQQFDLKGSHFGRDAKPGEQVKKDNDWVKDGAILYLPVELKRLITDIITSDARFLMRQQVLDYSILVGIHDRQSPQKGRRYQSVKLFSTMLRNKILPIIRKAKTLREGHDTPRAGDDDDDDHDIEMHGGASPASRAEPRNGETDGTEGTEADEAEEDERDGVLEGDDRQQTGLSKLETEGLKELLADDQGVEITYLAEGLGAEGVAGLGVAGVEVVDVAEDQEPQEAEEEGDLSVAGPEYKSEVAKPPPGVFFTPPGRPKTESTSSTNSALGAQDQESLHAETATTIADSVKSLSQKSGLGAQMQLNVEMIDNTQKLEPFKFAGTSGTSKVATKLLRKDSWQKSGSNASSVSVSKELDDLRALDSTGFKKREVDEGSSAPASPAATSPMTPRANSRSPRRQHSKGLQSRSGSGNTVGTFQEPGWEEMLREPYGPICGATMDLDGSSRYIYFIGIIDFLTPWDNVKKGEYTYNSMRGRGAVASCLPPEKYAERQLHFFTQKVLGMYSLNSAHLETKTK